MKRKLLLYIIVANCLGYCCAARQQQPDTSFLLPDPLITLSGKKITNKKEWEKNRRPEMVTGRGSGTAAFETHRGLLPPCGVGGRYHTPSIFGEFSNLAENKKMSKVNDSPALGRHISS